MLRIPNVNKAKYDIGVTAVCAGLFGSPSFCGGSSPSPYKWALLSSALSGSGAPSLADVVVVVVVVEWCMF